MTFQGQPNIILSFDTTGNQDSIAVSIAGKVEVKCLPQGGSGVQSAILVPEMVALLQKYGYRLRDVDLICVLTGPGSFTGIRLGLATAQGLKIATNCRVFAPNLLDLLLSIRPDAVAAVDSKRNDYFVKLDNKVQVMEWEQLHQLSQCRTIITPEIITGIKSIVPQAPLASEVIAYYARLPEAPPEVNLEPYYLRNPDFAKKKTFMQLQPEDKP